MNYDEVTHHFMTNFYECFAKDPTLVDSFYAPNSKLIISYPKEPQKVTNSNQNQLLPKGDHKIFRWNGQKNGEQILGHVTGCIKTTIDENNVQYYQSNEMIIYIHAAQDQNQNHPYQILYHSIHLANIDPPPQLEQKPEPKPEPETKLESEPKPEQKLELKEETQENGNNTNKKIENSEKSLPSNAPTKSDIVNTATPTTAAKPSPSSSKPQSTPQSPPKPPPNPQTQQPSNSQKKEEKGPVLVDSPDVLIKSRTVLAINLPFNYPQSSIIPEFEIYGKVTRYAIVKGRILIEFENPNSLTRALEDGNFYWNNRYIKIKQMDDQFNF